MQVEIRFFASLVDAVGQSAIAMEIDPAQTPAEIWAALARIYPTLGQLGYRPLVAGDLAYIPWDSRCGEIREMAFLPPLSGG